MKLEVLEHLPEANSNATPLLFVHGASHGAWCWKEHFLPYFSSNGFFSYALSLRGHGKSEGYDSLNSFSLNDYMEDVLEIISSLKNKPVLIGHSMGGAIAQRILYFHPDKIKAIVLMASIPPYGLWKDIFRITIGYYREVIIPSILKRCNYGDNQVKHFKNIFLSKQLPDEESSKLIKLLQPESNKARRDLTRQIVHKSISASVPLLILGSKRDYLFSEKTTINIGKTYKTKPVIFPNISHDMMLDPDWRTVADKILAFIHGL